MVNYSEGTLDGSKWMFVTKECFHKKKEEEKHTPKNTKLNYNICQNGSAMLLSVIMPPFKGRCNITACGHQNSSHTL